MKFSERWLREWTNPAVSTETLVEQLTMAGLEVDAVEPAAGEFTGVIVGEITAIAQHPDADKLRVCQVNNGSETVQVVCGAANARQGIKVPFATVGAVLPNDFKIKKAKLRGIESFGMLCAEEELGLAEKSDGLMELAADAPVGADIREYLQLDDTIIDIDLTPNRADCLSIQGVAREVAVLNQCDLEGAAQTAVPASIEAVFPVTVSAEQDCPCYAGRVVQGVDVSVPTPLWMQERLRRSGIRSIDIAVDITNYVMLELGQPMHAFDLDILDGGINVRLAQSGEKITLLDGQEIELADDALLIADNTKPLALAGIMGGEGSGVSASTKNLFLEAAFFAPERIAGRARHYGLHTESSHRFERGVDYQLPQVAIERATRLLLDIAGGEAGPVITVASEATLPKRRQLALREKRIEKILGLNIEAEQVTDMLARLGLDPKRNDEGWELTAPSYRFDIAIEADVLEEIARIYGYNNLPVRPVRSDLSLPERKESDLPLINLKRLLLGRGYQEIISYSFVDKELQQLLEPDVEPLPLLNPISSDLAVMRSTLFAGLLTTAEYNLKRQQLNLRLFETGLTFVPSTEGLQQRSKLALLATGRRLPESCQHSAEGVDFFDIKGDLEALLGLTAESEVFSFEAAEQPQSLHPGQSAVIKQRGKAVGSIGALHPQIRKKLGINQAVYLAEIDLSAVIQRKVPEFSPLSKFPEVRRDLAIVVDKTVFASEIDAVVRENSGEWLQDLTLFDTYMGKGIDPQRKSLAFGLTFRHSSRTLNENEINVIVDQVVSELSRRFDATLRN